MPAKSPKLDEQATAQLLQFAEQLRARRKALGVSATTAAEAANMSRPTVFRIEKGEPSVTIGAYLNLASALGLALALYNPKADQLAVLHDEIELADYPQLRQLAWHVKAGETLTPLELWQIIQRNQKHLDRSMLDEAEQALLARLEEQFQRYV